MVEDTLPKSPLKSTSGKFITHEELITNIQKMGGVEINSPIKQRKAHEATGFSLRLGEGDKVVIMQPNESMKKLPSDLTDLVSEELTQIYHGLKKLNEDPSRTIDLLKKQLENPNNRRLVGRGNREKRKSIREVVRAEISNGEFRDKLFKATDNYGLRTTINLLELIPKNENQ